MGTGSEWKEDAEENMDEIKLENHCWKILENLKKYKFDFLWLVEAEKCNYGFEPGNYH